MTIGDGLIEAVGVRKTYGEWKTDLEKLVEEKKRVVQEQEVVPKRKMQEMKAAEMLLGRLGAYSQLDDLPEDGRNKFLGTIESMLRSEAEEVRKGITVPEGAKLDQEVSAEILRKFLGMSTPVGST